jgi:predicted dehydrogenase
MPRPITSLRAGIIGTGFIGPAHLEALARLGVRVSAIVDNDRARVVADQWGVPHAICDLDHRKLVTHPEVDVVHIASPNKLHARHAADALKAGKHVVCEKPLAMTSTETARLVKLAAARPGQVFAVNYNIRFYPAILQLRAAVRRGDFGRIFHVNGSYLQDWLLKDTDYNWRLLPHEGGALRAVSDIGTHWMDAASFVLGSRIGEVYAQLETLHRTRKRPLGEVRTYAKAGADQKYETYPVRTEDYAAVLLRWASGVFGSLNVSQVAAGRKNCLRLEIYGSEKSAWWNSEQPNTIHYGSRDGGQRRIPPWFPRFCGGRRRVHRLPRRPCRGFSRHLQDELPRHLHGHRLRPEGGRPVRHRRGRAPRGEGLRRDPEERPDPEVGEGLGSIRRRSRTPPVPKEAPVYPWVGGRRPKAATGRGVYAASPGPGDERG